MSFTEKPHLQTGNNPRSQQCQTEADLLSSPDPPPLFSLLSAFKLFKSVQFSCDCENLICIFYGSNLVILLVVMYVVCIMLFIESFCLNKFSLVTYPYSIEGWNLINVVMVKIFAKIFESLVVSRDLCLLLNYCEDLYSWMCHPHNFLLHFYALLKFAYGRQVALFFVSSSLLLS